MTTFVCILRQVNQGPHYNEDVRFIKPMLASSRAGALKRGNEWVQTVAEGTPSGRADWDVVDCVTIPQFISMVLKQLQGDHGFKKTNLHGSGFVSEKDSSSIYWWYEEDRWKQTTDGSRRVPPPPKEVKAAVDRACRSLIKGAGKGRPVMVFF